MWTLNIKQLDTSLFGVVEVRPQHTWFATFAQPGVVETVKIDDDALDAIADNLFLDADGLMVAARRYVNGEFRPKTRGLGGSQLGDFGEALTYLINRAVPGRDIQRVIGWRAGPGQKIKGTRFPQPDFIVRENGLQTALEVKSTEAFDYQRLLRTIRWTYLKPCAGVETCQKEALEQLGHTSSRRHLLQIVSGNAVSFPVSCVFRST